MRSISYQTRPELPRSFATSNLREMPSQSYLCRVLRLTSSCGSSSSRSSPARTPHLTIPRCVADVPSAATRIPPQKMPRSVANLLAGAASAARSRRTPRPRPSSRPRRRFTAVKAAAKKLQRAKAELRELERAPKVKVRRRAADFMVGLTPAGLPAAAGFAPRSLYNSPVEKPPSERFVNGTSVSNDGRSSNELSDSFGTASPYPSSSILVVS